MNPIKRLKTAYMKHRGFIKVLTFAVVVNLLFAGALVFVSVNVKDITVTVNGKGMKYKTWASTPRDMLEDWEVKLDDGDVVEPGLDASLQDDMNVDIKLIDIREETVTEKTDFKTKKVESSEYVQGEEKVTTKGKKGKDRVTYEVVYLGGEEQSRREIARKTIKKPRTKIITVGTAYEAGGEKYTRKLTVQATAYSGGGTTASGTKARVGEIAVDPSVIPLGSQCYIEGFGVVYAEDTGGAVKGNIIDIYMSSRSKAINWGRRTVTIYVK